MHFISYAQNFEDVMLWRALQHVKHGFYIDVGANDPTIDSVTKSFYERGWHGINIEPLSEHIDALNTQRPHDINLQIAISDVAGDLELWDSEVRGWASANPNVIEKHVAQGHVGCYVSVPTDTLRNICEQHSCGSIHFLKIDVEGLEKPVLLGNNWAKFRPWIVVIEATQPNSKIENHLEWEHILTENAYLFAYADGLNRFYVAQEHNEIMPALTYPPNIFDSFIKNDEHIQTKKLTSLSTEFINLHSQCTHLDFIVDTQNKIIDTQKKLIELQSQWLQISLDLQNPHSKK